MSATQTREQYLGAYAEHIRREVFSPSGLEVQDSIRISVGFPSKGALSRKRRVIGQCWSPEVSEDGYANIFISPVLSDPIEVGATLVHELVHAAIGTDKEHGPTFKRAMGLVGLEGKPTATIAGVQLAATLAGIVGDIGPYPHGALKPHVKDKVQGTRLLKAECPSCGYCIRITRKWIDEVGLPTCPACDRILEHEEGGTGETLAALTPEPPLAPPTPSQPSPKPEPEYLMGHCSAHLRGCLTGFRRVRAYHGKLLCDHCWTHRKRL